MKLVKEKAYPVIISALKEDIGSCDITSAIIFEKDISLLAHIITKEECILAGVDVAKWVFDAVDEKIAFTPLFKDGDRLKKNKRVISVKGSVKNILSAERTVLNFLGHLSGVATVTNKFVKEVKGTAAKIYDTRKTIPGLREMEKYAVVTGGGFNHRMGLWDGVLIKDNHINGSTPNHSLRSGSGHGFKVQGSRLNAIKEVILGFKNRGYKNIEVEVENIVEFKGALEAGADIIMLDNMEIGEIRKAVRIVSSKKLRPLLEVSGGVNLDNIKKISKAGVDRISIGKLTHSAPSIDFSLEIM